jgi:hypothetical protein
MTPLHSVRPWYRHPEPWLLLIAPLVAVVGGVITLWLALHSNNSLVVDDYYREGRAINQTFERDALASQLGLSALWEVDGQTQRARLTLAATDGGLFTPPDRLFVRLIHATEADLDHRLVMTRVGDARWEARFAPPAPARWTLQIEDPDRTWRLLKTFNDPAAKQQLRAANAISAQSAPKTDPPEETRR